MDWSLVQLNNLLEFQCQFRFSVSCQKQQKKVHNDLKKFNNSVKKTLKKT